MTDVELALYDHRDGRSRYFFSPVSTVQGLRAVPDGLTILSVQAYLADAQHDHIEVPGELIGRTCGDLLGYLVNNTSLNIINFEVVFKEGVRFSGHDDFEATFDLDDGPNASLVIGTLVSQFGLSTEFIRSLEEREGHYCRLNGEGHIDAAYPTFDDYLKACGWS